MENEHKDVCFKTGLHTCSLNKKYHSYSIDEIKAIKKEAVADCMWDDDRIDKARLAMGSVYCTKEEAQLAVDKQKALVRVNRRILELNGDWVVDWENDEQRKFLFWYNYNVNKFYTSWTYSAHNPFINSCASMKTAEQIIDEMEADLKLIWGIKE